MLIKAQCSGRHGNKTEELGSKSLQGVLLGKYSFQVNNLFYVLRWTHISRVTPVRVPNSQNKDMKWTEMNS